MANIATSLRGFSKELEGIVKQLTQIKQLSAQVANNANKLPRGTGTGQAGLGGSPTNLMTWSGSTRFGGGTGGGGGFMSPGLALAGNAVANVAGVMYGQAPNLVATMARAQAGFSAAMLSTAGMNQARLTTMMKNAMGTYGMSAPGSDLTTAAMLASRGIMPGTALFRTAATEVGGAYRVLGMENEAAARGLGQFYSGTTAANLYRYGVQVSNPATGKPMGTRMTFEQIYRRHYGNRKVSAEEVSNSIRAGIVGRDLRKMFGDNPEVLAMAQQYYMNKASGRGELDLGSKSAIDKIMAGEKGAGNLAPQEIAGKIAASETEKMAASTKAMYEGFDKAASTIVTLNDAFIKLDGALGGAISQLSAFQQGLSQTKGGNSLLQGIGNFFGALLAYMGIKGGAGLLKGGLAGLKNFGSKALSGAKSFASKGSGILKFGGKALPIVGTAATGYSGYKDEKEGDSYVKGLLTAMGIGGAAGAGVGLVGGPAAPVTVTGGALIGATTAGIAYVTGRMFGKGGGGGTGFAGSFGGAGGPNSSGMSAPIKNGVIGTGFGAKGDLWASGKHTGVDYPCPIGTPVHATQDGVVSSTGFERRLGNYVKISHSGGIESVYGHLSKIMVKEGTSVKQGDIIGKSGDTGNVTGPHLHYEVRRGGAAVDPTSFLTGASIGIGSGSDKSTTNAMTSSGILNVTPAGISGSLTTLGASLGSQSTANLLFRGTAAVVGKGANAGASGETNDNVSLPSNAKTDLVGVLKQAGFEGKSLAIAYAVMMAESGGRANAVGDKHLVDEKWGPSYGLFQIRSLKNWEKWNDPWRDASRLGDPLYNAQAAWAKSKGGKDWSPWTAYNNGNYKQFLGSAGFSGGGMGTGFAGSFVGVGSPAAAIATGGTVNSTVQHKPANVTINVTVQKATEQEAISLAKRVKRYIDDDSMITKMAGN